MTTDKVTRRLAAILAADVVGYSRLIRVDEDAALRAVRTILKDIVDPKIAQHDGRIVKLMGDGILAEFVSVVDAVRFAVAMQEAVGEHQAGTTEDRRIVFRIGINLGDVVIDGDDIQGDGVNLAARLEGLCEPSGVCISEAVHDQVRDRLNLTFGDLGEREVKNIDRPVRAWGWSMAPAAEGPPPDAPNKPLPPPDKPSIAVLPFDIFSENSDYEFLADGLIEDIITLLARMPGFFVIARNSSFSYKGQQRDVREVGRELGVRYVVEGSLRPLGKKVRINVQLIEAGSGNHIWAERFDRAADEIFEIQDEITTGIVTRLEPALARAEFDLVKRQPPSDMDAWAFYRQAQGLLSLKGWHEETFAEAAGLYRKAIALDPQFAPAHASLALVLAIGHMVGFVRETEEAFSEAERALELDSDGSEVLGYAGCALSDLGQTTRGEELLERAIEHDPSNAQAWVALGGSLLSTRRFEEAAEKLEHGIRISPRDQRLAIWRGILAIALGRLGRQDEAIEQARLACRRDDKLYNPRVILAMLLKLAGRTDEAKAAAAEAIRIRPALSQREMAGLIGRKGADIVWSLRES